MERERPPSVPDRRSVGLVGLAGVAMAVRQGRVTAGVSSSLVPEKPVVGRASSNGVEHRDREAAARGGVAKGIEPERAVARRVPLGRSFRRAPVCSWPGSPPPAFLLGSTSGPARAHARGVCIVLALRIRDSRGGSESGPEMTTTASSHPQRLGHGLHGGKAGQVGRDYPHVDLEAIAAGQRDDNLADL